MGGGDGEDDPGVHALAVDSSGNVYVGGGFTTAGDVPAENVAKWDSTAWSALGTGIGGTTKWPRVSAVAAGGSGSVYAGGNFTTAGGVEVNYIAKWDGVTWSALGTGMDDDVWALTVDSLGDVYAGGYFTTAGGVAANYIAKWDGTAWSTVGTGTDSGVRALALAQLPQLFL